MNEVTWLFCVYGLYDLLYLLKLAYILGWGLILSKSSNANNIGDLSLSLSFLNEYPWKLALLALFFFSGLYHGSSS